MTVANRVLIVDDDPPTCELIRDVLSAAEIEACGLTSSTIAALRLSQQRFDAVFLDARMPSPNGLELTRQMRRSGPNKKSVVVMITGDREPRFITRAFECGVTFILFKPVDRQSLSRLLRATQGLIDHERRRFTRVNVERKLSMKYGQDQTEGTTVDISAGGMLVKATRQFLIGSVVQIVLELDGGKAPLTGYARVTRHTGEDFMGLEFETVAPADSKRLQEFLLPHILQLQKNAEAS